MIYLTLLTQSKTIHRIIIFLTKKTGHHLPVYERSEDASNITSRAGQAVFVHLPKFRYLVQCFAILYIGYNSSGPLGSLISCWERRILPPVKITIDQTNEKMQAGSDFPWLNLLATKSQGSLSSKIQNNYQ